MDVSELSFALRVAKRLTEAPVPTASVYITPWTDDTLAPNIWIPRDALAPIASAMRRPFDVEREALSRWLTSERSGSRPDAVELPRTWSKLIADDGLDLWVLRRPESRTYCTECRTWTGKVETVDTRWLAWLKAASAGDRLEQFQRISALCPQGHLIFRRTGQRY